MICKLGFLSQNNSILITADILILQESEDTGPSILFVYSLRSTPSLKPHISVEMPWSLVNVMEFGDEEGCNVWKLFCLLGKL